MAKRKQTDDVRKMRLIILGIALVLVAAVVAVTWFTLNKEAANGELQWRVSTTTTTEKRVAGQPSDEEATTGSGQSTTAAAGETTTNADGLPYDKYGSDLYAEWNGRYPSAEVIVKKDDKGAWCAYVNDKKVKDCTGIYCNEYGWWFVRDGEVDFNYTGIAANEKGKWYVDKGRVNFNFNGTYTADRQTYYTIVEGEVIRES